MVGSQALIAFKNNDGLMTVKTYNLVSYKSINQTELIYDVSDEEAEYESGEMRIFATIKLPEKPQVLNQVWQVGGRVVDGKPAIHDFQPENLNSKATLDLIEGQSDASSGGNSRIRNRNVSVKFSILSFLFLSKLIRFIRLNSELGSGNLRFKGYILVENFQESEKRKKLRFRFLWGRFLLSLIWEQTLIFAADSRSTGRCKLGNYASHWNNVSKIPENIQALPSSMVLPACFMPGFRLRHRSRRLGDRPETRGPIEWDPIQYSPLHWHHPFLCSHPTGLIHF